MKTKRKRPPSRVDLYLADPAIAAATAAIKSARRADDVRLLTRLVNRLDGRRPRKCAPRLLRRCHCTVYRDPVLVIHRYLRRHTTGDWHRGGHHVARYHGGPGIGLRNFRNDRRIKLQPTLLNA